MDPNLKVNMFVGVCKTLENTRFVRLNDIAEILSYSLNSPANTLDRFTLTDVVPKYKGKIGQKCGHEHDMGSISLTLKYRNRGDTVGKMFTNFSLFVFKTSVRIAGGVHPELLEEIQATISDEPIKEFCKLLMLALFYWSGKTVNSDGAVHLANINALYRHQPIPGYLEFCRRKLFENDKYDRVILPFFYTRGAVSTCHIYPMANKNCCAKLTSKGAVQFMGFQEVDMLHVFADMIKQDLIM